jgi:sigma-B regulation protein RsbU (phosphoserine phosphatase)
MILPGRKSLAFKMIVTIFTSVMLIFCGVFFYSFREARGLIYDHAQENARNITQARVNQLDSLLSEVDQSADDGAAFVMRFAAKKEHMVPAILTMLSVDNSIYGSTIALEDPGEDGNGYAPYYYRKGKELAYVNLADGKYNYRKWDWYKIPKETGVPLWSEPYFDEGGGNILMTTYSVPLYRTVDGKREFFGVLTADLSLEFLKEMMSSVKVFDTGYGLILSRKGTFISHPFKENILKNNFLDPEFNKDPLLREAGKHMIRGESGFIEFSGSKVNKKDNFMYYMPLARNGWTVAVAYPKDELLADVTRLSQVSFALGLVGFLILFGVIVLIAGTITRPLRILANAAGNIAGGDLETMIPAIRTQDEIGFLAGAFTSMQVSLKNYIRNLTETTSAKERMESELKIARNIQMGFVPRTFPAFPDRKEFDLFAEMEPAREVGGDLYDYFTVDGRRLCFIIGDISGKGVAAALYMAMMKTMLRNMAMMGGTPAEIISHVNVEMCRDNPSMMFLTVLLGILDTSTGDIIYCNAGHTPPAIMSAGRKGASYVEAEHGPPCGLFAEAAYCNCRLKMNPGELLFLYTDGVTECVNDKGAFYTEERLIEFLSSLKSSDPKGLISSLMVEMNAFMNGAAPADDITSLAITYIGSGIKEGKASVEFSLQADVGQVQRLLALADDFISRTGVPRDAAGDLLLALEEAFVNVCNYAHPAGGNHEVRFTLGFEGTTVVWSIEDDGVEFNPLEHVPHGTAGSLQEMKIGGQGIRLVAGLMDGVEYRRQNGRNILTGRKKTV